MRKLAILITILLYAYTVLAADVTLLVCSEAESESGSPRVKIGYTSDTAYEHVTTAVGLGSNGLIGDTPHSIQAGSFPQTWGVELVTGDSVLVEMYNADFYTSITVDGSEPPCPPPAGTGQPDGGLHQIVKVVEDAGVYQWQIWSGGAWDNVVIASAEQKDGAWVVVLVLGADNPVHDADNYRVERVG